ncbi:IS6 family transposase [Microbaculum sp. FT89]|uniref:IS6 family transposase n=1 Tax=Microbaculum sp. FT89 TaxID=3447298 RepID=UPI003F53C312
MTKRNPFRSFKTSPEIIRLAVMLHVRFPLSLRNVEDLLHERGIDVSHETIRFWWNRFGPIFAAEIRRRRIERMGIYSTWRWHVDEMFVKINGEVRYLWRAVDHEGEVLEAVVTKRRDRKAALKILRKLLRRYGRPREIVTDRLPSYGAALKELGAKDLQSSGRWLNNRVENAHLPLRRRERAMLRFRRMRSLQTFAAVHASVSNHFNQERSLSSRKIFKLNRAAALEQWRQLGAA